MNLKKIHRELKFWEGNRITTANGSQNPRQALTWSCLRISQYVLLKSRTHLLVKNFPESDDGSFIQMSFISTDLEVKGITEQLLE